MNPPSPTRQLYVATSNPGKLRDFAAAAALFHVTILPLPGLATIPAPPEDEPTFAGNARLKAGYYSRFAPGEIVLADDSGLSVDALDGAPGVRSARYAADLNFIPPAPVSTDEANNLCLLHHLATTPPASRTARYRCVIAAARDEQTLLTADGTVEGTILTTPRGNGGFGYDPLFFLPELDCSMAEIDLTLKATLSHRGRALRSLLDQLHASGAI